MINITTKNNTLRKAIAKASLVVSHPDTMNAIKEKRVPKGEVLEMARTAGLFAAKRTADVIPDCHPLPIEFTQITYEMIDLTVHITVEIHTIYKTGVEVEAMHAATIVALTMYDMLKPIDKNISIEKIHLVTKKGGKSQYNTQDISNLKSAVIVCSDSVSQGKKQDTAGKAIIKQLEDLQLPVNHYKIIPDDKDQIQQSVKQLQAQKIDLIILTGGTGLSPRDVTPEAVYPLLDKTIDGIAEAIRSYGQNRTPYAMLSRSVVGTIGESLIIALPGSTQGAKESMEAIFPAVLHVFPIMKGATH